MDLRSLIPWVAATGLALRELDEDKSGADDYAAELLIFAADLTQAAIDKLPLPEVPEALRKGVDEKIKGPFRATLIVVKDVLTIAKYSVSGSAREGLGFVVEALALLVAREKVPSLPASALPADKPKVGTKKPA